MARVTLEASPDRPAWEVRVDGKRVGLTWRELQAFRGIIEGEDSPLSNKFNSREAAAKALARRAGFFDLDPKVVEIAPKGKGR